MDMVAVVDDTASAFRFGQGGIESAEQIGGPLRRDFDAGENGAVVCQHDMGFRLV